MQEEIKWVSEAGVQDALNQLYVQNHIAGYCILTVTSMFKKKLTKVCACMHGCSEHNPSWVVIFCYVQSESACVVMQNLLYFLHGMPAAATVVSPAQEQSREPDRFSRGCAHHRVDCMTVASAPSELLKDVYNLPQSVVRCLSGIFSVWRIYYPMVHETIPDVISLYILILSIACRGYLF